MQRIELFLDDLEQAHEFCEFVYGKKKWRKRIAVIGVTDVPEDYDFLTSGERIRERIAAEEGSSIGVRVLTKQRVLDIVDEELRRYHGA